MRILNYIFIISYIFVSVVQAQHSIDVQKLTAQGEHYQALLTFDKMAKRQATIEAKISAAKSAWALGLVERAVELFEESLRDPSLTKDQRARLLLSRGVIEYQEQHYQVAILYVEKVLEQLKQATPLRAKAWSLWGESLFQLGTYAQALEKYRKALNEANDELLPEVNFLVGRCLVKLGKFSEAQPYLESLPVSHDRTPEAIRQLITISLETENYTDAEFWLSRARDQYNDQFIDSWVDYALVKVAINKKDTAMIKNVAEKAQQKFPPSDHWVNLMQAEIETYEWQKRAKLAEVH